jgi:hypothetical protein
MASRSQERPIFSATRWDGTLDDRDEPGPAESVAGVVATGGGCVAVTLKVCADVVADLDVVGSFDLLRCQTAITDELARCAQARGDPGPSPTRAEQSSCTAVAMCRPSQKPQLNRTGYVATGRPVNGATPEPAGRCQR